MYLQISAQCTLCLCGSREYYHDPDNDVCVIVNLVGGEGGGQADPRYSDGENVCLSKSHPAISFHCQISYQKIYISIICNVRKMSERTVNSALHGIPPK